MISTKSKLGKFMQSRIASFVCGGLAAYLIFGNVYYVVAVAIMSAAWINQFRRKE